MVRYRNQLLKPVFRIQNVAAWLCLGVILLGSGGAHVLHAIPGLGHHDHSCCHSHRHTSEKHPHEHAHCGHSHHGHDNHKHAASTEERFAPLTDLSGKRWTTTHDCVLCEIIAVLHHGTLLVDQPVVSSDFAADPFYLFATMRRTEQSAGLPTTRGPPIS